MSFLKKGPCMLNGLDRIYKICSIVVLTMSNQCTLIFFKPENIVTMKCKLDTSLQSVNSIRDTAIAFESGILLSN